MSLAPSGPKKNHKKGIAAAVKTQKREQAVERQETYDKLTLKQKIARAKGRNPNGSEYKRLVIMAEAKK